MMLNIREFIQRSTPTIALGLSVLVIFDLSSAGLGMAQTTRLGTDAEAPPQRLALLIGNSNYEHLGKLKNPRNDVDQLAVKLDKLGFQTYSQYDLNHDAFVTVVSEFQNRIAPGDIVLFYYSGHGIQAGGTNYLLPVNMPSGANTTILQGTGISLTLLRTAFAGSRMSLIILDACRTISNLPAKGAAEGLAPVYGRGSLIAYAADEGQTASDNDAEDVSLFTKHLIQELDKHDETLCQLFGAVRRAVDEASGHVQFPFVYDGVIGEFVFNRTTTAESRKLTDTFVSDGPDKAWTTIQASNNPNDFVAFLASGTGTRKYEKAAWVRLSSLMSSTAYAVGLLPLDQATGPEIVARVNQAERLFYERDYSKASGVYKELASLRSDDASALYNYATCLLRLGLNDEAIDFFSRAIAVNPQSPWAYYNRGVAHHLKGDLGQAINDYSATVERRPTYAAAYNNLALAKRDSDDLVGAESDAKKAIGLDSMYAPAFFNTAEISSTIGKSAEAADFEYRGKLLTVPAPVTK